MSDQLQRNKDVFRNFLLAIGRGDADAVAALVTDDVQIMTMGTSVVSANRNREQLLELVKGLSAVTENGIALNFISFTAEEDRVSCEMTGCSTLVTGGEYNNQYHLLARIRDGKLCLLREYIDTKYTDATLGVALAKLKSSR
jgi:ketosteroid isomerase-like protein